MEKSSVIDRLDAINEFDREPVSKDKLQGSGNFAGLYAGEHVAGTEFVIGPLFVAHGVAAGDLIFGLLIGNLLAVLSWAFICAPIATRTRLNMYWQLRKITGPYLLVIYNIVNALMFCFLAGSMIAVAATAVGIPFNMPMPGLNDMYPNSFEWVVVVLSVGTVVTLLAILGFKQIARFSKIAAPWMFLVFVACGIAVLPQLGVNSVGDFWRVANETIWTGVPQEGQSKFTFWHVMFFAWFCNMAMHIGMADMTILRYAKKWQYGFFSAFGMYLGHFVAWIASGILVALAIPTGRRHYTRADRIPWSRGSRSHRCSYCRVDDGQSDDLSGGPGYANHNTQLEALESNCCSRCHYNHGCVIPCPRYETA